MPLSKAGKKIKANLEKQYGEKKGEGIFYAMENKGEIPGMKKKGYNVGGQVPNQRGSGFARSFVRNQARAMNAMRQTPPGPGGMQARQAQQASATRPSQVGAMQTRQANEAKLIAHQKRIADAAAKGLTPQARRAPTRPSQVGNMQTQRAALSRRQGMNTADAQTNLRNRELALKMAASRGPTQQARRAPAGKPNPGARQMSAAEAQRMTRTRPSSRRRGLFSSRRRRGFAEGGMVKSTGKLDTGIKKCGE